MITFRDLQTGDVIYCNDCKRYPAVILYDYKDHNGRSVADHLCSGCYLEAKKADSRTTHEISLSLYIPYTTLGHS